MDLAIRVDLKTDGDSSAILALLDSLGGSYWVVREGGTTNAHAHIHWKGDKTLPAVRAAFKRKFPGHVGNGGYSIKQCDADVEGYDRYMAKGDTEDSDPIILGRQGIPYTLEAIAQWHTDYWEVNQELLKKRRKKLKGAVADQLLQRCRDKGLASKGAIGREYLSMVKESNMSLNIFAGKAAINTVWLQQCKDSTAFNSLLCDLVGEYAVFDPE